MAQPKQLFQPFRVKDCYEFKIGFPVSVFKAI